MKTKYQNPVMEYLFAETGNLLEGSQLQDIVTNGQDLGGAPTTNATEGNLSRMNVWDDED